MDLAVRQSIHYLDSSPEAKYSVQGESKLGRLVDALALGGDEGRDKLR